MQRYNPETKHNETLRTEAALCMWEHVDSLTTADAPKNFWSRYRERFGSVALRHRCIAWAPTLLSIFDVLRGMEDKGLLSLECYDWEVIPAIIDLTIAYGTQYPILDDVTSTTVPDNSDVAAIANKYLNNYKAQLRHHIIKNLKFPPFKDSVSLGDQVTVGPYDYKFTATIVDECYNQDLPAPSTPDAFYGTLRLSAVHVLTKEPFDEIAHISPIEFNDSEGVWTGQSLATYATRELLHDFLHSPQANDFF